MPLSVVRQQVPSINHGICLSDVDDFRFVFAYDLTMPPRKLPSIQVLERLLTRLEKRMEALQRVKLDGFQMVISELENEMDYLRRAQRYLED